MNRFLTPEHLHAAVNHLPLIGLCAACIPLLYGVLRKQTEVLIVAFLMCVLFGGSMALVMKSGEEAEDRFEKQPMSSMLDAGGKAALDQHEDQAKMAAIPAYATAALGLLGLVVLWRRPSWKLYCGWLTLVVALIAIGLMLRTADSGGQIRHPEFRSAVGVKQK